MILRKTTSFGVREEKLTSDQSSSDFFFLEQQRLWSIDYETKVGVKTHE